jgi:predicted GIY-YIG superfamily endonuclease
MLGRCLAAAVGMGLAKCIVYVLKSEAAPPRYYTGLTSNLAARLDAHNAGRCPHTASGKPWTINVIVEFSDERRAVAFERYLKSGSRRRIRKAPLQMTTSKSALCPAVGAQPSATIWRIAARQAQVVHQAVPARRPGSEGFDRASPV